LRACLSGVGPLEMCAEGDRTGGMRALLTMLCPCERSMSVAGARAVKMGGLCWLRSCSTMCRRRLGERRRKRDPGSAQSEACPRLRHLPPLHYKSASLGAGPAARGGYAVRQLVIDNPVINSVFKEPGKHFKFTDDGIADEIVEARRPSAHFIPVAQPKKKGKQLELGTEWTLDRLMNLVIGQRGDAVLSADQVWT